MFNSLLKWVDNTILTTNAQQVPSTTNVSQLNGLNNRQHQQQQQKKQLVKTPNLNDFPELSKEEREQIAKVLERAKTDENNLVNNNKDNKRNSSMSPENRAQSSLAPKQRSESTPPIKNDNLMRINNEKIDNTQKNSPDLSNTEQKPLLPLIIDSIQINNELAAKEIKEDSHKIIFNCKLCKNSIDNNKNLLIICKKCNNNYCNNCLVLNDICNNCRIHDKNDNDSKSNNDDSDTFLKYAQNKIAHLEETLTVGASVSETPVINNQVTTSQQQHQDEQNSDSCYYSDSRGSFYNRLLFNNNNSTTSTLNDSHKKIELIYEKAESVEEPNEEIVYNSNLSRQTSKSSVNIIDRDKLMNNKIKRRLPTAPKDDTKLTTQSHQSSKKHLTLPQTPSKTNPGSQAKLENVTEWLKRSFDKLDSTTQIQVNTSQSNRPINQNRQFSDDSDIYTTTTADDIIEIKYIDTKKSSTQKITNQLNTDKNPINKDLKQILLYKDPKDKTEGLGIRIAARQRVSDLKNDLAAIVNEIVPDGLVQKFDVPIRIGEEIVEINGICLRNKTQQEIIQILDKSCDGEIEILVRTRVNDVNKNLYESQSIESSFCTFDPGQTSPSVHSSLTSSPATSNFKIQQCLSKTPKIERRSSTIKNIESIDSQPVIASNTEKRVTIALNTPVESVDSAPATQLEPPQQTNPDDDNISNYFETTNTLKTSQSLEQKKPKSRLSFKLNRSSTLDKQNTNNAGEIQLQIEHSNKDQELIIKILKARNLLAKDTNGLSDPFVKVYLLPGREQDNKRRTKSINKTLNPEWNSILTYTNLHRDELKTKTLEFTVWDYDRFKSNDFLGLLTIDLNSKLNFK